MSELKRKSPLAIEPKRKTLTFLKIFFAFFFILFAYFSGSLKYFSLSFFLPKANQLSPFGL